MVYIILNSHLAPKALEDTTSTITESCTMGHYNMASQDTVVVASTSETNETVRWNHLKVYVLVSVSLKLGRHDTEEGTKTEQAVLSLYFCELLCIVGGGFLAPQVAAVIGGMELVAWPSLVSILFTVALGAIICQGSD